MTKDFKVFSLDTQNVTREVEIDGVKTAVQVPSNIAQLVPAVEDGTGTLRLMVPANEVEKFVVGEIVSVTFGAKAQLE